MVCGRGGVEVGVPSYGPMGWSGNVRPYTKRKGLRRRFFREGGY